MIGKQLKQARLNKGITQKELADSIGVSVGAVKRWEQDLGEPNTKFLISITKELDVSTNYLFGLDVAPDYVDDTTKKIIEASVELPDARRQALLEYAEYLKEHMR